MTNRIRAGGYRAAAIAFGALVVLLVASAPSVAVEPAVEEIDVQLREQFDAITKEWAGEVWDERNEAGDRYKRASFSKNYRKVDEATYRVTYSLDTAEAERLRTELVEATISKASGSWELTDHAVKIEYAEMVRDVVGAQTFHRFDSFTFEREGLRVRATNGTLLMDYLLGEPEEIVLAAADLSYEYAPPTDLPYNKHGIYENVIGDSEFKDDFLFRPKLVAFRCDPESCRDIIDSSFSGLSDATEADLDDAVAKQYRESVDETNERLHDDPFSGFRLPVEPDRRTWTVSIKKDGKRMGKDHWLWLDFDTVNAWHMTFGTNSLGPVFAYLSKDERDAGIEPYEVELRDDPSSRDYQLTGLHGTVELGIEGSELLKGDLIFDMEIKRPVRGVSFFLNNVRGIGGASTSAQNASITVDAVEMDGEDVLWVRRGASGGMVVFPVERKAGDLLSIRLQFRNEGSMVKLTPSYVYMDRSGWLPFTQFTDKIDTFELTVRAPAKYKTLGIGTKVEETVEGDVRTTKWKANSPVTFPTIIFGDYVEATPDIEAKKADGTLIPVTIHVDKDGMQNWEIRPKQLKPLAEQAVNALNFYREIYGMDYPYGKLDLVNDPQGFLYGQAPASIVYLGSGAFRGVGMLATSTGGGSSSYISKFTDTLVAHEVAHQWWGALVGNKNQRNYWFVESLAEYSAALYLEAVRSENGSKPDKGYAAYLDHVDGWRRTILDTPMVAGVQDASYLWSNGGYQAAVYNKGPYAMHILRMTFGYEKTVEFLRTLAQDLGNTEIVTRDIQRIAEKTFGGDMNWFFDQWIRGAGIPEYRLTWNSRKAEDGTYIVQGDVTQRIVVGGRKKYVLDGESFRGIVTLTVIGHDHKEYGPVRFLVEDETTPFQLKFPVEPSEVILNRDGEMLANDIVVNRPFES